MLQLSSVPRVQRKPLPDVFKAGRCVLHHIATCGGPICQFSPQTPSWAHGGFSPEAKAARRLSDSTMCGELDALWRRP